MVWEALYEIGHRIDKTRPKGGQPCKPVRWMIRGLFLQYLYQLSDPQLEDHLIDRLSFWRFAGLPLDQNMPDFTTFWRFREVLASEGLVEEYFEKITDQVDAKGLLLLGTVVDGAIIDSVNWPLSDKEKGRTGGGSLPTNRNGCQFSIKERHLLFRIMAILAWMRAVN